MHVSSLRQHVCSLNTLSGIADVGGYYEWSRNLIHRKVLDGPLEIIGFEHEILYCKSPQTDGHTERVNALRKSI